MLKEEKEKIIKEFALHENDRGSVEVQIGLLTRRIKLLEQHLKKHPKDFSSKRALYVLISRRNKFLKYLQKNKPESYKKIISAL
ncbi:MAG: 30S ribosomal protein S15 [Candidatus Calescibacterium sp.]|nr:30S ribosomal protein S15 [Candidatus Calescibacterium sp.]MDW8088025.1 30S ribosomal protein S15 [Candidatus Calescibacterium sp.]